MSTAGRLVTSLKRPEYTGDNRCLPCTVVNLCIAAIASLAVAAVLLLNDAGTWVGAGASLAVFGACSLAIYLRGYLVPGTPSLTKRYFPEWLLAAFGKGPAVVEEPVASGEFDPEEALLEVGAVEECQDGTDLCLTDGFRDDWNEEIVRLDDGADRQRRLLELLDVDDGAVEVEEYDDAFQASVDGQFVGTWESEAAFLADLAAARVMEERVPDWNRRPIGQRGGLLNGLRLFVDTCPSCRGDATFETETVESCCSTREVAAVSCADCGARLFESRPL